MGRMEKVNQLVKREISNIIQREIADPRLRFVTITAVEVSPDLHVARVSFSVLGDDKRVVEAEEALEHAKGYLRKLVGKRVILRYTPALEFVYDDSIAYGARIEQTLEEIKKEKDGNVSGDK